MEYTISVTWGWGCAFNRLNTNRSVQMGGPSQVTLFKRSRLIGRLDACIFGYRDWDSFGHPSIHLSTKIQMQSMYITMNICAICS
jgi:hypothetical protein